MHFYPRSPCGERPVEKMLTRTIKYFYPRSPCGERRCMSRSTPVHAAFLSTLSLRRATSVAASWFASRKYFYPRSPCGERLAGRADYSQWTPPFLSTLSLRRATVHHKRHITSYNVFLSTLSIRCTGARSTISIHALLAESDIHYSLAFSAIVKFLSTLSLRRATQRMFPRLA